MIEKAEKGKFTWGGARQAKSLVGDLINVVREVNTWRQERDAFIAMYVEEERSRKQDESRAARSRTVS